MAEIQNVPDQEVAPMHQDVQSTFSDGLVAVCVTLGAVAITVGIVLGIVLAND